jgi:hypothetical protein
MKRILAVLAVLACLSMPALAQDATPDPWAAGTEEIILQTNFHHDSLCASPEGVAKKGGCWQGNATFGWGHFITDRTEIGAVTAVLYATDTNGFSYGPSYQFNLPLSKQAGLFFGGDGTILAGDVNQLANFQVATRIGAYVRQGRASVKFGVGYARALDTKMVEAKSLDRVDLMMAVSFGIPQQPTAP